MLQAVVIVRDGDPIYISDYGYDSCRGVLYSQ